MLGVFGGGLGGIIVISGIIYFSGAGSWLLDRIQALDEQCYLALTEIGFTEANPVCAAVASGVNALDGMAIAASDKIDSIKQHMFGATNFESLQQFTNDMQAKLDGLSSSGDSLRRIISAGPQNLSGLGMQPFQQAIDSFTIGQGYLKQDGMSLQGINWLKAGASQPHGYGVMSQLSLGNVYATGAPGISPNPQMAQYYLTQANKSLALLSANHNSQSQQILGTLPLAPDQMRREIERSIRQIQMAK